MHKDGKDFSIMSWLRRTFLSECCTESFNRGCGVVVITTGQVNSIKSELRFYAGSNPASGVMEICDDENL